MLVPAGSKNILYKPNTIYLLRYEMCWLPILAEHGANNEWKLQPPQDVHWIWHCHMLAPKYYHQDYRTITGMFIYSMSCLTTLSEAISSLG